MAQAGRGGAQLWRHPALKMAPQMACRSRISRPRTAPARGGPRSFAEETEMRVSEVMTRGVRVANPDQTIGEAARLMAELDAGALPVGEEERLVGMITDRDIAVRAPARGMPASTKVSEIMSQEGLYCFEDEEVAEVAQNMSEVKVRRLPVVDRDKRLVGIVSLGDVSKSENAAAAGQTVAEISTPGGAHAQRKGSKKKNAKPV